MTDNHGYNQPSQGVSDWHVPLNENFAKLDRDVEIRDTESNLGNYDPKDGAKFLATDTGSVFVGDGSQWQSLPSSFSTDNPSFGSVSADSLNNEVFARPGEVQTAIDNHDYVRLLPEVTYNPSSAWKVRSGATLECAGAIIEPAGDNDVFHVHPDARILNPNVNTRSVSGYSSDVFRFDPAFNGNYDGYHATQVKGGITRGTGGEGTLFAFYQNGSSSQAEYVSFVDIDHQCDGTGTVVEMIGDGSNGWINDNIVRGFYRNFEYGIVQRGMGDITANQFYMSLQPAGYEVTPRWAWVIDHNDSNRAANDNVFWGNSWDDSVYSGGQWKITGSGTPWDNVFITFCNYDGSAVQSDSGGNNYLLDLISWVQNTMSSYEV